MVSLQNVLGHYCAETMELHKAYVRTICRICGIKASASAKCYKLSSIVDIVKLAYQGLDGSDVTLDSAETESDTVCQKCYRLLKNWNSDHNKYLLYKRKNPTKIREFVTSHKLPDTDFTRIFTNACINSCNLKCMDIHSLVYFCR